MMGHPCPSVETSPSLSRLGFQSVFTSFMVLIFSVRYYISLVINNDEISTLRYRTPWMTQIKSDNNYLAYAA